MVNFTGIPDKSICRSCEHLFNRSYYIMDDPENDMEYLQHGCLLLGAEVDGLLVEDCSSWVPKTKLNISNR